MVNRLFIKIILIIVLVVSIFYLIWSSQQLSCGKCVVTFKKEGCLPIKYNMSGLFKEGGCPIYFDKYGGCYVRS